MADVLQIGVNVATPLGVIGLIVTALLYAYYRRLKYQENQLQSLPEEMRAQAVDTLLSRYNIDGANLTREQKYELIRAEMDRRAENLKLCVIVSAVVFVFCFALGTVAYVAKANPPHLVQPGTHHGPSNPGPNPDPPKANTGTGSSPRPAEVTVETKTTAGWTTVTIKVIFVGSTKDACDKGHTVRIKGKDGDVEVQPGEKKRIELSAPTRDLFWFCGGTRERAANELPFDVVECDRSGTTGAITWNFYKKEPVR